MIWMPWPVMSTVWPSFRRDWERSITVTECPALLSQKARTGPPIPAPDMRTRRRLWGIGMDIFCMD